MVPPSWLHSAKPFLKDIDKAFSYFEELLKNHPEPSSLLNYLNERRFTLLLMILEQSRCLRKFLLKHPTEFQNTIPNLWYLTKEKEDYLKEIESLVSGVHEDEKFSERLAFYRHRELMRIFSKELLGTASYEDILREYSYLPDALVEASLKRAWEESVERYREPKEEEGKLATATVIGLGKLGSEELNYYSDIDLIFLHSSDKGNAGRLSLNEFFTKLFQKVVKLLTTQTPEGIPYIVDLDLRPFGKSGPLSMSLRSAELYYESYGRIWERFALLRARHVAGDRELAERFMKEVVKPFVFAPSDYKLIEEIKLMKKRVEAEAKKRFIKGYNVKTGEGGIREVEFSVQALVILLGAKSPLLRESNTYRAIYKLMQKGVFSSEEAQKLEEAYTFLRKLEHRIQLRECLQTQVLREQEKETIAKYLGYEPEAFDKELSKHRSVVRSVFEGILPEERTEEYEEIQEAVISEDTAWGEEILKKEGFKFPRRTFLTLTEPLYGSENVKFTEREKKLYIKLIPKIIELSKETPSPDDTIKNFFKFFLNPTGRRVILSEDKREEFLEKLFKVFSLSGYLSHIIARNPDLVEDALTLYRDFPSFENLEEEFKKYRETLNLSPENLYRRFKNVWEVRIGLLYLLKEEDKYTKLKKLLSSLSLLAEFILKNLWRDIGLSENNALLYALGKLGSRELSIGSDLDLVFCVKSQEEKEEVHEKAKKLVAFLTAHTQEGYLYSVDFRLRPMGSKGELVPTYEFYKTYFDREARTWERLAWTRARAIEGKEELINSFEKLIRDFLFKKPWGEKERREVYDMRMKLESASKRGRNLIDIKLGKGGIVDGEFLVQYLLIKEKIRESSMIRGFEILKERYEDLNDAYESFMFLRLVETHLRLIKERGTSVIKEEDIPALSLSVGMREGEFREKLRESMRVLRETFNRYLSPQKS
ncbi:bifunctional [glutamate--ammonia ligase]-adenylyl-L-tyrosine phosphorylase/[glutamate--ammonia-ligase] adenylyltransferase [Aquifex pyrophilus]